MARGGFGEKREVNAAGLCVARVGDCLRRGGIGDGNRRRGSRRGRTRGVGGRWRSPCGCTDLRSTNPVGTPLDAITGTIATDDDQDEDSLRTQTQVDESERHRTGEDAEGQEDDGPLTGVCSRRPTTRL